MKTVIFANGEIQDPIRLESLLQEGDALIAADGGLNHIRLLGRIPDLVIGDLDSVGQEDLQWLAEKSVEIKKFPTQKDQTDLELAILEAVDRGAQRIIIAGGLGGRIDQTLANINLLLLPEIQALEVSLDDGLEELFLIQRHAIIWGREGDLVSLIALNLPAREVRTKGLEYKLHNETLFPERSRGISNVMKGDNAEVSLENGVLLCVHTRISGLRGMR